VRQYYEQLWERLPEGLEPDRFERRRSFLLGQVQRGDRALDLGCGAGEFTAALAEAGVDTVGADVAEAALARARARHPELQFVLVPFDGPLPFEDGSFELVWAGEVIEHVADTTAWLSEIRRVLRSGGSLLATTPAHGPLALARVALSRRAYAEHFDPRSDHLRFYSRETLAALLADFGFEAISMRSAGGAPGARRLLLARAVRSRF
jgi:ubiquinone/menaquinone biosynthesis C-methylase UbiE